MWKTVIVKKSKNFKHVIGNEYIKNFFIKDNKVDKFLVDEYHDIFIKYENLKDEEHEDYENVWHCELGTYYINCGDFDYTIEILEGMIDI